MSNKPVIIIGAGCAGLSAAYQLKKRGVDFLLLESTDRVGGRTGTTYFDPEHPDAYYQNGATMSHKNSVTSQEYIKELLPPGDYVEFDGKVLGFGDGKDLYYFDAADNPLKSLMGLKCMPKSIIPQGVKFMANLAKALSLVDGEDYDRLLPLSNINSVDWAIEAGGPAIADNLVGPLIQSMVMTDAHLCAAAHPVSALHWLQGFGQIKGGFGALNDALYEKVKDSVRFNAPVEKVTIEDGAVKGVKLVGGEVIESDHVILCTDATLAAELLPDAPEALVDDLKVPSYAKIWHYVFTFPKRFVPEKFALMLFRMSADSKVSTVLDENINDVVAPKGTSVMHCFVPDHHADEFSAYDDETREQKVREAMAIYWPQFLTEGKCVCAEYFHRGVDNSPIGEMDAVNRIYGELDGCVKGLLLAGEYGEVFSSTEGAYKIGKREALRLADELGATA